MDAAESGARRPGYFHGGLLLAGHKLPPLPEGIPEAALPERLVLPVSQHLGEPVSPRVSVGDRVLRGEPLTGSGSLVSVGLHAPTSGRVVAIEARPVPEIPTVSRECIVLEPDGDDERGPELPTLEDYLEHPPQELVERIRAAGIAGLGGAVFPTHVKLTVPPSFRCDVLVLNGAECEPYISCDMALMADRAAEIIEGARIMMHVLAVTRCVIGIERDKDAALDAMERALSADGDDRFELVPVEPVYPAGGERQLIKVLLDREVPSGGLPIDVGCVCQNVGTAYAVYRALLRGEPLTRRVVTVTGPGIRQPRNLMARLGTPVGELVRQCDGYAEGAARLLLGGPMMGVAAASDEVPVTKGTNCILVLTGKDLRRADDQLPCIRCGDCARACPAQLLPQQLHWYGRANNLDQLLGHGIFDCIECGCCDLVCPSHIHLTQGFREAKFEIWSREREREEAARARERFRNREARLAREREEQEARRRGRNRRKPDAD